MVVSWDLDYEKVCFVQDFYGMESVSVIPKASRGSSK